MCTKNGGRPPPPFVCKPDRYGGIQHTKSLGVIWEEKVFFFMEWQQKATKMESCTKVAANKDTEILGKDNGKSCHSQLSANCICSSDSSLVVGLVFGRAHVFVLGSDNWLLYAYWTNDKKCLASKSGPGSDPDIGPFRLDPSPIVSLICNQRNQDKQDAFPKNVSSLFTFWVPRDISWRGGSLFLPINHQFILPSFGSSHQPFLSFSEQCVTPSLSHILSWLFSKEKKSQT